MKFNIKGHKNVLSTHTKSFEFTKDKELTLTGDCIVGVDANFSFDKKIVNFQNIKIEISCGDLKDVINAKVNPNFNHESEIVIRKSNFISERTLGINADKSANDLNRELINKLKDPDVKANVYIEGLK